MAARTDMSHDPLRLAWRRFRANRLAAVSALLLILLTGISLISLPFSMRWYNVQSLDEAVRHSPSVQPIVAAENFVDHTADATTLKPAASAAHQASSWLGHDDLGRSLLYRLLPGFLISMLIGVLAAVLAVGLGTCWGAVAGQIGGHVDMVMMRIVDMLYGLPYVLMVILLKVGLQRPVTALLGDNTQLANVAILIIAIGSVSWLTVARVVRGQVLSLREQPFVEAARAAGATPTHILVRHMIPNLIGPILVYATLVVPQAILQESFLSFLGIGVQQPIPSLGSLAADGVQAVNVFVGFWWLIAYPCGALILSLMALNFLGDGLRDAFDPKSSAATLV